MKPRTISDIARITDGKIVSIGDTSLETPIANIITDSRNFLSDSGSLFAALTTTMADGHSYIDAMLKKGVRVFLVERVPDIHSNKNAVFIQVKSVKEALKRIALDALEGDHARRVIITGSYAKTTVKELLYTSLVPYCKVARSPRSWNSSLGLPLSILDMEGMNADIEICEVAIDGPSQSTQLLPMLEGEIGILTAIGPQHDECFASHEDKIKEKLVLLQKCHTIIYPAGNKTVEKLVREMFSSAHHRLVPVECEGYPAASIVSQALLELGFPANSKLASEPLVSTMYTIREAAEGNIIIRDNFTPDLRELRESLEFVSRRFTAAHTPILLIGNLLHGKMSEAELRDLYTSAYALVRKFGISKIISVGDEWKRYGYNSVVDKTYLQEHRPVNSLILATGVGNRAIEDVLSSIESASHDTTLDVDLEAMIHNYNYYRSLLPSGNKIVAMVKASAYGLGAVEIAKTLQSQGASYLAVAVIDEGVSLREAGITMPIMVLNPITNRYPLLFERNLEPAVFSIEELKRLISEAKIFGTKDYPVHIKLDTGMHRLGFIPSQFEALIELLKSTDTIKIKSIFTHLATADCLDKDEYTERQIADFQRWCDRLESDLGYSFMRHYLNTAGMMRYAKSGSYQMSRLGIGLYGISPYENSEAPLQAVASFRTRIISLKEWEADTFIGYGNKGVTTRRSIIATIPVGYADGVDRHLGRGNASFVVRGHECPTIGNICMDLCMIDVTDVPGVAIGDQVEIFGTQMPIERIARVLDTIPYEVLTSVSPRVKRQYSRK